MNNSRHKLQASPIKSRPRTLSPINTKPLQNVSNPVLSKHERSVHALATKHGMLGMARMRKELEIHTIGEDRRDEKIRKLEVTPE